MRRACAHLGLFFAALLLFGCNDRGQERDILSYSPGSSDGGIDGGESVDAGSPKGPPCDGPDGANCRPPRAFGVCLGGECQRVACVSGFIDCDSDPVNGCETRVDVADSCGACGVSCLDGEACQFGQLGFTCASEVVCRLPTFDVDLNLQNGCEWSSSWDTGFAPGDPNVGVVSIVDTPDGVLGVGQLDDETPHIVTLPDWAVTPVAGPASGPPSEVEWDDAQQELLGVWPQSIVRWDGVNLSQDTLACENELELVDVDPHPARTMVAFEEGVLTWETRDVCRDCEIAGQLFEREDYLRAFWPGSGTGEFRDFEVSSCTPCSLDPATGDQTSQTACGLNACRPQGEPLGCDACDPAGCPDFRPVRVFSNQTDSRVYIVTARGLLVMRFQGGWIPEWRLEKAWDPNAAGGFRVVDASIDPGQTADVITLLDNSGRLSTVQVPLQTDAPPAPFADVGLGQLRESVYTDGAVRLVPGPVDMLFVGEQGRSAAIRSIDSDDGPRIAGLEQIASTASSDGFISLYRAPGVYFIRRFTR